MRRILVFVTLALSLGPLAQASPYLPMIDAAAKRHGVDQMVFRALVETESGKRPWAFNIDSEGFIFQDERSAIQGLYLAVKNPWLLKVVPAEPGTTPIRMFFPSQEAAEQYLADELDQWKRAGIPLPNRRTDKGKDVQRGEVRIRKLRTISTDIGIAQINYRWNGSGLPVQQWFDPAFNLDFAARYLSSLIDKHGDWVTAVGYYHSQGNQALQNKYRERVTRNHQREMRDAQTRISRI